MFPGKITSISERPMNEIEAEAIAGNAAQQCLLGLILLGEGKIKEAKKWFKISAARSNKFACYELALIYLNQYKISASDKNRYKFILYAKQGVELAHGGCAVLLGFFYGSLNQLQKKNKYLAISTRLLKTEEALLREKVNTHFSNLKIDPENFLDQFVLIPYMNATIQDPQEEYNRIVDQVARIREMQSQLTSERTNVDKCYQALQAEMELFERRNEVFTLREKELSDKERKLALLEEEIRYAILGNISEQMYLGAQTLDGDDKNDSLLQILRKQHSQKHEKLQEQLNRIELERKQFKIEQENFQQQKHELLKQFEQREIQLQHEIQQWQSKYQTEQLILRSERNRVEDEKRKNDNEFKEITKARNELRANRDAWNREISTLSSTLKITPPGESRVDLERSIQALREKIYQLDTDAERLKSRELQQQVVAEGLLKKEHELNSRAQKLKLEEEKLSGVADAQKQLDEIDQRLGIAIGNLQRYQVLAEKFRREYEQAKRDDKAVRDRMAKVSKINSSLLHQAVHEGDLKQMMRLISFDYSPNYQDERQNNSLHLAVIGGHVHIIRELLQINWQNLKKDVNNRPNIDGNLAIHIVCQELNLALQTEDKKKIEKYFVILNLFLDYYKQTTGRLTNENSFRLSALNKAGKRPIDLIFQESIKEKKVEKQVEELKLLTDADKEFKNKIAERMMNYCESLKTSFHRRKSEYRDMPSIREKYKDINVWLNEEIERVLLLFKDSMKMIPRLLLLNNEFEELKIIYEECRTELMTLHPQYVQLSKSEQTLEVASQTLELNTRITNQGYEIQSVERDGNCLYAAISDQLCRLSDESLHRTADQLRALASNYLIEHREQYENFIVLKPNETYESYIERHTHNNEWGGHLQMHAISEVLKINIQIIANDTAFDALIIAQNPKAVICLGYETGLHYQSVFQKQRGLLGSKATLFSPDHSTYTLPRMLSDNKPVQMTLKYST
ncbi:MAG: ankyrin repeat domain-containing protein [Gammaproteobacteria bacterium]